MYYKRNVTFCDFVTILLGCVCHIAVDFSMNCSFLHLYLLCLNFSSAADDLKASPGVIEAVIQHPSAADKV